MTAREDLSRDPWLELRLTALGMTEAEYAKRRVDGDLDQPVLVWQMGKVASRSFVEAIERTGDYAVFHLHHTDTNTVNSLREQSDRRGEKYSTNLKLSIRMLEVISELREAADRKIRIVSAVRDPLARNVSAFFTNLKLFSKRNDPQTHVERLTQVFLNRYRQSIPLTWFDREIKATLGIDIYRTPFDRERAQLRITEGPFDLLVLRAEDDDRAKEAALNEFFEREDLKIVRANVGSSKQYADIYAKFLEELAVPEDLLHRIYDSRLCRHFYTDEERAGMRAGWRTAGGATRGEVKGDSGKPTVLVIDPDALNWGGHFMAYNDKLTAALEEQGHPVKVICNKKLDADILERRPNFVPRLSIHTWVIGHRFPKRPKLEKCESELETAIDELAGEEPAIVYIYCGSIGHASILSRLIDRNPRLSGQVNLFWEALHDHRWEEWVNRRGHKLRKLGKGQPRLQITVPTARLQRAIAQASGRTFDVAPHPSTAVADPEFALGENDGDLIAGGLGAFREVRGPFRVLFPGTLREGKGFDNTVATARRLAADRSIRPVIRDHPPASMATAREEESDAQTRDGRGLTSSDRLPPNVEVVRGALDNEAFLDLFRRGHISVLPYDPKAFAKRTSGLLIDSLYHGLPLVVPEGTWLGDIVEQHGCGVVVAENSPDHLAEAVHEVIGDYPEFATKARSAARAYFAGNSWKALAQSIVDKGSWQPVTGPTAVTGLKTPQPGTAPTAVTVLETRIGDLLDRQRETRRLLDAKLGGLESGMADLDELSDGIDVLRREIASPRKQEHDVIGE